MKSWLSRILYIVPFLLAGALSIKSLREPDLWWQIRTGQWILQHGRVPNADPFSFTHLGKEWINIKWGFEVMAACLSQVSGPESVFLIQLVVSLFLVWIFYQILRSLRVDSPPVFFVSTLVLLVGLEYRMIGRPEMFTHLFTLLFIWVLLHFRKQGGHRIWLLIPLQILWSNMHEAYGMGPILLLIFSAGNWIDHGFKIESSTRKLGWVTLLSTLGILVNPRGTELLLRPLNIFQQVQTNKYTTELSACWTPEFWGREAWLMLVLFFTALILWVKKNGNWQAQLKETFGTGYLLITLSFVALGLTAYRNLVFPLLLLTPIFALLLQSKKTQLQRWSWVLSILGVLVYMMIVRGDYYRIVRPRDHFGLQTLSINNPVGAANYIQTRGLSPKKCFSDYLTSSYLMWRFQPGFKTYIDLRDLDVFSNEFFDDYLRIMDDPNYFHEVDKKYRFDYVVLYRQMAPRLHAYLYNDSIYACTFADPVAIVYEKTDDFTRGDIFAPPQAVESSPLSTVVNHVFNPAYRPFDYKSLSVDFEAAEFYYTVGLVSAAEKRINSYLSYAPDNANALQLKQEILQLKSKLTH